MKPQERVDAAVELMRVGKWDEAKQTCLELVNLHPTFAPARAHLGICFFREGDLTQATLEFERATTLDESYWEAGIKLVQCYDRLQRYEDALETAQKFLQVRPNDSRLQIMAQGLSRHVNKITDRWQLTVNPGYHRVEMSD